jgi:hypothetical protein
MSRYVQSGRLPSSTRPSHPARLRAGPQKPPKLEVPSAPLTGESATTAVRAEVGASVPVSGPVKTTKGLASSSGRIPGR